MATDAELMHQDLEPLAAGETADQEFVGTFDADLSATNFRFTLTSKDGRVPALVLTTAAGKIAAAAVESPPGVWTVTVTVHYLRADTFGLSEGDWFYDLWDTDNNARVAAGIQPVVTPSRYDTVP